MHPIIINNNIKAVHITVLIKHKNQPFFLRKGESADKRCRILLIFQMYYILDSTIPVNNHVYFTDLHNH